MTIQKRIRDLLIVLIELLFMALLLINPAKGKITVVLTMQVLLAILGIRYLLYYFTMARHMVDGRSILYKGGILLDLGVCLGFSSVIPSAWIMFYLIGYFMLQCVYRCLKALDTRKIRDRKWIRLMIPAFWYLLLALLGLFNLRSESAMVYLFSVDLMISAAARFSGIFRKTAIVYIQ